MSGKQDDLIVAYLAAIEKFGGDSVEEMRRNAESYLKCLVIS